MMMMMMMMSQELCQQQQQQESTRGAVSSNGTAKDQNRADIIRSSDDQHVASTLTSRDTFSGNEYY